jgi:hypothetical protein
LLRIKILRLNINMNLMFRLKTHFEIGAIPRHSTVFWITDLSPTLGKRLQRQGTSSARRQSTEIKDGRVFGQKPPVLGKDWRPRVRNPAPDRN